MAQVTDSPHSPWTPLHDRLHHTLRHRGLLPKGERVLIAVSGGQDSLTLTQLLLDLRSRWGWELAIAHCNHRWRSDADANAAEVAKFADTRQLPYFCRTTTVAIHSEASARDWRYAALTEIALAEGYGAIATGHTASDRGETLLYNLLRGSGADGLQALTWSRELSLGLRLVRPLLDVTRQETAQFCQAFGLPVWEDSTNNDWRYARNRIRQELLPYLRQHFNPQVEQTLAQTAELLQAEVAYLETLTDQWYEKASQPQEGDRPSPFLNRKILQSAPLALQRRVVRRFLSHSLERAPGFDHIEKVVALINAPNRSQTDPFPGGAIAQVQGDEIHLVSSLRLAEQ